ncbi:hypothetical protein ElyMa_001194500 [Elysia marginata]|uniref:Uncharacterized protein n=1 Tax=Elysia marginata TaxID=1093978 RepID=A0AAV4I997_9GAST|nr:hypothetical protein ElyMa_001194500 [Elysia marginata]
MLSPGARCKARGTQHPGREMHVLPAHGHWTRGCGDDAGCPSEILPAGIFSFHVTNCSCNPSTNLPPPYSTSYNSPHHGFPTVHEGPPSGRELPAHPFLTHPSQLTLSRSSHTASELVPTTHNTAGSAVVLSSVGISWLALTVYGSRSLNLCGKL